MDFLLGSLATAAYFISLYFAYRLGTQSRKLAHKQQDEQEKRKAERLRQGFQQLMSYDVSKAYGKKVD